MRELKFRAWIIPHERMVRVAGFNFGKPIQVEVPRIGKEKISGRAWDNPDNFEFWNEGTEAIIMQYTGMKDKNGKEIYEGDIIDFGNWDDDGERANVEFDNDRACFIFNFFSKFGGEGFGTLEFHRAQKKTWEVIGNIYDNPELLN